MVSHAPSHMVHPPLHHGPTLDLQTDGRDVSFGPRSSEASFKAIFYSLKGYFLYFLRLFLRVLEKYPWKQGFKPRNPRTTPTKLTINIASAKLGVVRILRFSLVPTIRTPPQKIPLDEEGLLWGCCVVRGPLKVENKLKRLFFNLWGYFWPCEVITKNSLKRFLTKILRSKVGRPQGIP